MIALPKLGRDNIGFYPDNEREYLDEQIQAAILAQVFAWYLLLNKSDKPSRQPEFLREVFSLPSLVNLFKHPTFSRTYQEMLNAHPEKNSAMHYYHQYCIKGELHLCFTDIEAKLHSQLINELYYLLKIRNEEGSLKEVVYQWFVDRCRPENAKKEQYLQIAKEIDCMQDVLPHSQLFFKYRPNCVTSYYDKLSWQALGRYQTASVSNTSDADNDKIWAQYPSSVL